MGVTGSGAVASGGRRPARAALLFLLAAQVLLLAWGVAWAPPPLGAIHFVPGAERTVVAMTPRAADPPLLVLARLDPTDRVVASARLPVHADAIARVGGRLTVFGPGATVLVRERVAGSTEGPPFEVDRFDRGVGFAVRAAVADGDEAVIAGVDDAGRLRVARYDGIRFSEVAVPADVLPEAGAIALLPGADGTILFAARRVDGLVTGTIAGKEFVPAGVVPLPAGGPGLVLLAEPDCVPRAWCTEDGPGGVRRLVAVSLAVDGSPGTPVAGPAFPEGTAARLVGGRLERTRQEGESQEVLLVASPGPVRPWSVAAPPPRPAAYLAVWTSVWPRFQRPLLAQMALFVVLGMFARRTRPRERPPELPVLPLAGILRRGMAFLFDVGSAGVLALVLLSWTIDPAQERYLDALIARPLRAATDPVWLVLVWEGIAVFMMTLFATLAVSVAASGRSLGMALFGLRVVTVAGDPPGLGAAALRSVVLYLDIQFFAGLALVAFTRRRQRLGDLLAGTVVIDERRATRRAAAGGAAAAVPGARQP